MRDTMNIRAHLKLSPVVPVLTIHRVEDAVPLARALVVGALTNFTQRLAEPADVAGAIGACVARLPVPGTNRD